MVLKNYNNPLWLCFIKRTTKPGWQHICLQHGLLNILSLLLRTTAQKRRFLSKYYRSLTMPPKSSDRDVQDSCFFMPHNKTFILQPMDQEVISTFKSHYLRNTFLEATATIDSDFSDGSEQSQLKAFWKGFTILDAIKSICDSWEAVKMSTRTGVWKMLVPTLMDDHEGFKTSVKEVLNMVEIARELELEVKPDHVTELLQSHDKTHDGLGNASYGWAKKVVSWEGMYSWGGCCEDCWNDNKGHIIINLVDQAVAGFEKTDSHSERSSTVSRMLSNTHACYREVVRERKSQLMQQTSLLSYLRNCHSHPNHSDQSAMSTVVRPSPRQKDCDSLKARW